MWTNNLGKGGQIGIIYTDLDKAFDKVPLRWLISKRKAYAISENIVGWIQAFLYQRKQHEMILTHSGQMSQMVFHQDQCYDPCYLLYVVDEVKDLGVTLDSRLRFTTHINRLVARAFVRINLLFKCFTSRDRLHSCVLLQYMLGLCLSMPLVSGHHTT